MRRIWIPLVSALAIFCVGASKAPTVETINTINGPVTVSFSPKVNPNSLGVPLYPGAKIARGSEYTVKTDKGELAQVRVEATLTTKAPAGKVAEFYRKALKGWSRAPKEPEGETAFWKGEDHKVWIVTIAGKSGKPTSVEVRHSATYKEVVAEFPKREPGKRTRPRGLPRSV